MKITDVTPLHIITKRPKIPNNPGLLIVDAGEHSEPAGSENIAQTTPELSTVLTLVK